MRKGRIGLVVGFVALVAIVIWAWIDGGREPVREIAVEIPAPGPVR